MNKPKKKKNNYFMGLTLLFFVSLPTTMSKTNKSSMLTFSNKTLMLFVAIILIMTMLTVSQHAHHPNQTISSSF